MKKALFLISAITVVLLNFMTNAHAYDDIYVFGDSLSDGGNIGKFTIDGKNAELYDEYITRKLTNKKLTPSKYGGNNYAQGGATTNGSEKPNIFLNPTTQNQIATYLKKHSEKADPNGIYIHWVGGNNIAEALSFLVKGNKNKAEYIINNSSASAASQVNQLIKAGAGLIIVPNVPDIGKTPRIMDEVLTGALQKSKIPSAEIDKILKQTHKAINQYSTPNAGIRNKVISGVFKKIAENKAPQDPIKADEIYNQLLNAYNKTSKTASQLSDKYNQKVDEQLGNGNILRADVNRLLQEVIDDPTIYGFSNTLGYACPQGKYAVFCVSSDPEVDKNQSYLFSDNFHPTPYAHRLIGQYITSIYNAPLQVMVLNQVNQIPTKNVTSSLDGHLQQLRNGHNDQGKIGIFGGYTDSGNNTFTLGSDYQLTTNLLFGLVISHYQDEQNPSDNFHYAANGNVIATYALWNYAGNGWLSGNLHYSHTNYNYLSRTIQLGPATRRESGSTIGKQWGWRITAGWNIPITQYLTTSPIIQYAWDNGDINGYRESGNNSTSMHFGNQNYNPNVGSVGWRIDTQLGRFNPYASILFNHQFNNERYTLRSAINSTITSFVLQKKQARNHVQYTVGVNANLTNDFRAFAAVSHENSANDFSRNYNFNFGLNVKF
ncbi:autotransporter domain-containing protein [Xenorhabdus sp. Vera]|uniref:autotransporter outer membrane beta-barrel domain-containing protein n=1 Tax=Xenorhabdus koppenhoeferi TaxID=351659 RepID=UPI0019CA56C4|nr:autotransporter domain-containing protein [Xenorhabdus sp. Vera]MBD2811844.1 autotransporter domain-containing protein [Xenorhabdus sp. Vera]